MSSLLKQVQNRAMIGAGALHLRGEVKGEGLAQPWEEKASGLFNLSLPTPTRTLLRRWDELPLRSAWGRMRNSEHKQKIWAWPRCNENLFLKGAQSYVKPGFPERLCSVCPLWDWTEWVASSDSTADPALNRGLNYRQVPEMSWIFLWTCNMLFERKIVY